MLGYLWSASTSLSSSADCVHEEPVLGRTLLSVALIQATLNGQEFYFYTDKRVGSFLLLGAK